MNLADKAFAAAKKAIEGPMDPEDRKGYAHLIERDATATTNAVARAIIEALREKDTSACGSWAADVIAQEMGFKTSDEIQAQLGVCPACGRNASVVNTEGERFLCEPMTGGCGARWSGARLGTPA